jgi:hypothetical protein
MVQAHGLRMLSGVDAAEMYVRVGDRELGDMNEFLRDVGAPQRYAEKVSETIPSLRRLGIFLEKSKQQLIAWRLLCAGLTELPNLCRATEEQGWAWRRDQVSCFDLNEGVCALMCPFVLAASFPSSGRARQATF